MIVRNIYNLVSNMITSFLLWILDFYPEAPKISIMASISTGLFNLLTLISTAALTLDRPLTSMLF